MHGAGNVDAAVGIARRRDRLGELEAEAVAGQRTTRAPWIAHSVWRASLATSGLALTGAQRTSPHALHVILVDQHADMPAGCQDRRPDRRREAGLISVPIFPPRS